MKMIPRCSTANDCDSGGPDISGELPAKKPRSSQFVVKSPLHSNWQMSVRWPSTRHRDKGCCGLARRCLGDISPAIRALAYSDARAECRIPCLKVRKAITMKHPWCFGVWVWLICAVLVFARATHSSTGQSEPARSNSSSDSHPDLAKSENRDSSIDILTDTKGMDVHPYLERVLPKIKANWYKNVPESVEAPIRKKGNVVIGFRVMKTGKITKVELLKSSGVVVLDRAAYAGVVYSSPLPPLPSGFDCKYVDLSIHFYYFPDMSEVVEGKNIPCHVSRLQSARFLRNS